MLGFRVLYVCQSCGRKHWSDVGNPLRVYNSRELCRQCYGDALKHGESLTDTYKEEPVNIAKWVIVFAIGGAFICCVLRLIQLYYNYKLYHSVALALAAIPGWHFSVGILY